MVSYVDKGAIISECGLYRYRLSRSWGKPDTKPGWGRSVLWIMLNPSTADALEDDRTIGRCVGFADSWGYDGIMVGNLYAYRSTDPKALNGAYDPIGPENYRHIRAMSEEAALTVVAWGGYKAKSSHIDAALDAVKFRPLYCLGTTANGSPKHPLYLDGLTQREIYRDAWARNQGVSSHINGSPK